MASTDGNIRVHLTLQDKGFAPALLKDVILLERLQKTQLKNNQLMRQSKDLLDTALTNAFGRLTARVADFGAKLVRLNLKGFALELGTVTAGLLLMKASLATGRFIAQAWGKTVDFLRGSVAGLTAGVTALVAALAAANREFTTLQTMPFAGGSRVQAAMPTRMTNPAVQMMGIQGNQQVLGTLRKAGLSTNQITGIMPQLASISNGDPRAYTTLATALGQSRAAGSSRPYAEALGGQGSIFKNVSQQASSMSADNLIGAIIGGKLTPDAFKGQIDNLNNTLMGSFKSLITRLYTSLADMGWIFLGPIADAMSVIEKQFTTALFRIRGTMGDFARDMGGGIGDQATSFFGWMTDIINYDLPKLGGKFRAIGSWWKDFTAGGARWFGGLGDRMHPYEDSMAAAWSMTKKVGGGVWNEVKNTFRQWNPLIRDNSEELIGFGKSVGSVGGSALSMLTRGVSTFFDNLPTIRKFMDYMSNDVFPKLGDFAEKFMNAFVRVLPYIESMVRAIMPLVSALTMLIGGVSNLGGTGAAAVLGGMYFGMTARGRSGAGAYRKARNYGVVDPSHSIMSAMGMNAFARRGGVPVYRNDYGMSYAHNSQGWWKLGENSSTLMVNPDGTPAAPKGPKKIGASGFRTASGRYISGGQIAMGAMMAGSLIGMAGGDNQVTSLMQQMSMAAPLAMIPQIKWGKHQFTGYQGAAMAAGALGLYNARNMRGGLASGVSHGMSAAAMLAPLWASNPPLAAILTAGTGLYGYFKGKSNQRKYDQAGRQWGHDESGRMLTEMEGLTTRADLESAMESYDTLLGNDAQLKVLGSQQNKSWRHMKEGMQTGRTNFVTKGQSMISRLSDALQAIAAITGEAADDIEEQAARWGFALHIPQEAIDFWFKRNKKYKDLTSSQFGNVLTGTTANRLQNSIFVVGTRTEQINESQITSAASNTNFVRALQGGRFDKAMAQDVMSTTMALGQTMGLEGQALNNFVIDSIGGMKMAAAAKGVNVSGRVGSGFDRLFRETKNVFSSNIDDFIATGEGTQMMEMLQLGGSMMTKDKAKKAIEAALNSKDPELSLQRLNMKAHSDAAKEAAYSMINLASASERAATALGFFGGNDDASIGADAKFKKGGNINERQPSPAGVHFTKHNYPGMHTEKGILDSFETYVK